MKTFSFLVKYVIVPVSTLIGILFSIDTYIVQRANTVVHPTQIKVDSIKEDVVEIKERTKRIESILMERE